MQYTPRRIHRPLALCIALAAGSFAQTPQAPIDNDQARVVVATDQPHSKGAPHEHKLNRVMIYLQPGSMEITPQGAAKTVLNWRAGDVKWSPASGTHVSELTSSAPVSIVEIEVKKEGHPRKMVRPALDPLTVDPKHYHLEFENSQVRVSRVKIGPKESVPMHEHVMNRIVVYLTDQNTKITSADGKVEMAQHKAGEASTGGPVKHQEENLSSKPFEAVVVEFKS